MKRPIVSEFLRVQKGRKEEVLRANQSRSASNCVKNAVSHLQEDHYPGANVVNIYNKETGFLHAVLRKHDWRKIEIVYKAKLGGEK